MNPNAKEFIPRFSPKISTNVKTETKNSFLIQSKKKFYFKFPTEEEVRKEIHVDFKSVDEIVANLTRDEILTVFEKIKPKELKKIIFIEYYHLNSGNFSSLLKRKRNYPSGYQAILDYLFHNFGKENKVELKIESLETLVEKCKAIIGDEGQKILLFIDGDNIPKYLDKLKGYQNLKQICIIFYLEKDKQNFFAIEWATVPNFIFCHSLTNSTQAVGIRISMDAMLLHFSLRQDIKFVFLSGDGFCLETSTTFKHINLTRETYAVNPKIRSITVVLDLILDYPAEFTILTKMAAEIEGPIGLDFFRIIKDLNIKGNEEDILLEVLINNKEIAANQLAFIDQLEPVMLRILYKIFWPHLYIDQADKSQIKVEIFKKDSKPEIIELIRKCLKEIQQ